MANWYSKVCSNGPKVKDVDGLSAVLEKWKFKPDADDNSVEAEIDGCHLDIYGDGAFDPVPVATMQFFEALPNTEKDRVCSLVPGGNGTEEDILDALELYLDSDYEPDWLAFLREVQPHLAETLIVQQIGSMKCVYSFGACEWEVPAGEGPIVVHELGAPPKMWLNGERDPEAEVAYLRKMIQNYDTADTSVCDNCRREWQTGELEYPKDIMQRMDPGLGVVPSGQCPTCGALAYPEITLKTQAPKD